MIIQTALQSNWGRIVAAENSITACRPYIGTSLQIDLEAAIKPLCPPGIDYTFVFNMSGQTKHVFYEIANPQNSWSPE